MLKIGLTGGIACGKSMVSDYFNELGIPIIDTDVIARQLVEPNQPALTEIIQIFGKDIVDNKNILKRRYLREIVFNSEHKRKQLEAILHPKILMSALTELTSIEQGNKTNLNKTPYCIFVIPLLLETKSNYPIDRILVIDCNEQVQIERIMSRDNISHEQSLAIIKSQIEQSERLEQATEVIKNDADIELCHSQIKSIHQKYLNLTQMKTS